MPKIKLALFFLIILTISSFCENKFMEISKIIKMEGKYIFNLQNACEDYFKIYHEPILNSFLLSKIEIDNDKQIELIINDLTRLGSCKYKYGMIISDEKIFNILIDIIGTLDDRRLINSLCQYLYTKKNYTLIWNNSERIINLFLKEPLELMKLKVLILCNLGANEKKIIKKKLNDYYKDTIPMYAHIRLGDKQVEDSLINLYKKEEKFNSLYTLIEQIELSGTKRLEMELVKSLAYKATESTGAGENYSIRYYIIKALGRLNPEVTLLNDDFCELKLEIQTVRNQNEKITLQYMDKLYNWIYQKYKIKIEEIKKINFIFSYSIRIPHPEE